jgi:hypothetical protein
MATHNKANNNDLINPIPPMRIASGMCMPKALVKAYEK